MCVSVVACASMAYPNGCHGNEDKLPCGKLSSKREPEQLTKRYNFFQPPIIPKVRHSGDTRNFEDYPEDNWRVRPFFVILFALNLHFLTLK